MGLIASKEKTAKAHPKTEISEEKTLKPSEKMAMSEPSGDSSRQVFLKQRGGN